MSFLDEKEALIMEERQARERAREFEEKLQKSKGRLEELEQKEADLATIELRYKAEQERLDKGWMRLDTQVQKLVQARAKLAQESSAVQRQIEMNQELVKQIEMMRGPFDKAVEQIEEYARKLELENIREFWNQGEAEALTDIKQVYDYFRIKEVELKNKIRQLTEENEQLQDSVQRVRLQAQRDVGELKMKNTEMEGTVTQYQTEIQKLADQNKAYEENLKQELEYSQKLQNELDTERANRKRLEIVIQRKMIAREMELRAIEKQKRREMEEELGKMKEFFQKRKRHNEFKIQQEVKQRMVERFSRVKDDLVEKEVEARLKDAIEKERTAMSQQFDTQREEWLQGIAEQFQEQFYEQSESIKAEIKSHYRKKIAALQKQLDKRKQDLHFHND